MYEKFRSHPELSRLQLFDKVRTDDGNTAKCIIWQQKIKICFFIYNKLNSIFFYKVIDQNRCCLEKNLLKMPYHKSDEKISENFFANSDRKRLFLKILVSYTLVFKTMCTDISRILIL